MKWILKYLICLVNRHIWVGSRYQYCLRCGKLGLQLENQQDLAEEATEDSNPVSSLEG